MRHAARARECSMCTTPHTRCLGECGCRRRGHVDSEREGGVPLVNRRQRLAERTLIAITTCCGYVVRVCRVRKSTRLVVPAPRARLFIHSFSDL